MQDELDECADECQALTDELAAARLFLLKVGIRLPGETPIIDGLRDLVARYEGRQYADRIHAGQLTLFGHDA